MSTDPSSTEHAVSRILHRLADGEAGAASELLPLVYEELRRQAAARMRHEAVDHTLQPTALVHEAYLRLVRGHPEDWDNRRLFFGAAAEAMRRILIEHARSRDRLKRGGDRQQVVDCDPQEIAGLDPGEILAINEALDSLEQEMPDKAELVKLRYFAGLDEMAAAEVLGISRATAARWWMFARAWLFDRLKS
ncbi:MAG: sigma-70 family RNA polymerase sigma factor [Planctomycetota bacterium]|nr:MAG: sigma-70 family RNA polymerase sigma factor [Planctomycetota bacterium]